jgi:hypothetical protein
MNDIVLFSSFKDTDHILVCSIYYQEHLFLLAMCANLLADFFQHVTPQEALT